MFRIVTPHLRIESVLELDVPRLRDMGLDSLMLDVDCTLKSYGATDLRPEIFAWLDRLRGAGVGLCLLSNGRGGRDRGPGRTTRIALGSRRPSNPSPFGVWPVFAGLVSTANGPPWWATRSLPM